MEKQKITIPGKHDRPHREEKRVEASDYTGIMDPTSPDDPLGLDWRAELEERKTHQFD